MVLEMVIPDEEAKRIYRERAKAKHLVQGLGTTIERDMSKTIGEDQIRAIRADIRLLEESEKARARADA